MEDRVADTGLARTCLWSARQDSSFLHPRRVRPPRLPPALSGAVRCLLSRPNLREDKADHGGVVDASVNTRGHKHDERTGSKYPLRAYPNNPAALRGCLKRVQSSRRSDVGQALRVMNHEARIISQRPKRPGMATAGTTVAPSQTWRPANQVLPTGGSQRYPLCAAHRVRVADAPPRSAPMAYHVPLLPHVATGWELGAGPCGPA